MTNHGKSETGTLINLPNGNKITIWADTIWSGMIRVDSGRKCLYQKANCEAKDLAFAIEIGYRNIETNIFETD